MELYQTTFADVAEEFSCNQVKQLLRRGVYQLYVLPHSTCAVAAFVISTCVAGATHIEYMACRRSLHGQGLGSALLQLFCADERARAETDQSGSCTGLLTLECKPALQSFYKRLGLRDSGLVSHEFSAPYHFMFVATTAVAEQLSACNSTLARIRSLLRARVHRFFSSGNSSKLSH